MKVTVPMILIAVVCTSALILTGVAYSAEFTVDNNRIDTATVYCTLSTTSSIDVNYSTSGEITFGTSEGCTVKYEEVNGSGNAVLVMDVIGTSELNGKILNILQNGVVVGSSTFAKMSDNTYHADVRGFSVVNKGSFDFSAKITSVGEESISLNGGSLVFEITAYPLTGGQ